MARAGNYAAAIVHSSTPMLPYVKVPYNIIELTDLIPLQKEQGWPKKEVEKIRALFDTWLKRKAVSVGFFSSGDGARFKIDCYIPRYSGKDHFEAAIQRDPNLPEQISDDGNCATVCWDRQPFDSQKWQTIAEQATWPRANPGAVRQIIELVKVDAVRKMILEESQKSQMKEQNRLFREWQELRFLNTEMSELLADYPTLQRKLTRPIVRAADELLKRYDYASGYAEQQKNAHDLAIVARADGPSAGRVEGSLVTRVLGHLQRILDLTDDGTHSADLHAFIPGVAMSSSILLVDLESTEPGADVEAAKKAVLSRLRMALDAGGELAQEGDPALQARAFRGRFDNANVASRVGESIKHIIPAPGDSTSRFSIAIPREEFAVDFDRDSRKHAYAVHKVLYEERNLDADQDQATRIVRGELIDVHETSRSELHHFVVRQERGKGGRIKIYHPKSNETHQLATGALQTDVKLRVHKRGKKWFLKKWLPVG